MDKKALEQQYKEYQGQNLALDMTRGKPCSEQLDLSAELLEGLSDYKSPGGTDVRNYGGLDGLPELKKFFGDYLGTSPDRIIVGGNSSLNLMADFMTMAHFMGVGGHKPWNAQGSVKFICPVPGYDRHFTVCQKLGIEMITVANGADGPDMDAVETLAKDPSVKGIWLVPRYSNPTGSTISQAVAERLSRMEAAPDFRIMWDNAYGVHELVEDSTQAPDILELCAKFGQGERPVVFGSTSKITLAGAGIGFTAMAEKNRASFMDYLMFRTIGPDKVNQLRHLKFLPNMDALRAHMKKHAEVIKPKFDLVLKILDELLPQGFATYSRPKGGYFISFDGPVGTAAKTVELAGAAGVKLTPAGATFPYKKDPQDRNIRLAPTFPSIEELDTATRVFATCVQLAAQN